MIEDFENLSIDYINICVDETLLANNNNLTTNQIAHFRKHTCDKIIDMVKKYGVDFTIEFLKERINLKNK